jgi:hypothetical protein
MEGLPYMDSHWATRCRICSAERSHRSASVRFILADLGN